jgi:putative endonuclease
MYYFYILRCSDNSLYCGQTTDLKRRVEEHNNDHKKSAKYTKSRRPVKLVYSEQFSTIGEALKREYEVKQWDKSKKEKLLSGILKTS